MARVLLDQSPPWLAFTSRGGVALQRRG